MAILSYVLFILGLILNVNSPSNLSNIPTVVALIESFFVVFAGHWLINACLKNYPAKVRRRFFTFFLTSFSLSLIYLGVQWAPYMSGNFQYYAFDPVRYYYGCYEEIRYGRMDIEMMNYHGVVYIFTFFMRILGMAPTTPLYVNTLLMLYATLSITKFLDAPNRPKFIRYAPWLLLIPEVVIFDAMSSREILCYAGFTVAVIKMMVFVEERSPRSAITGALFLFLVLFVRPPYGLIAVLSMCVYMFVVSKNKIRSGFVALLLGGIVVAGMAVTQGGGDSQVMEEQLDTDREIEADEDNYQGAYSMSRLLTPHNSVEFVVFGIVRSFGYILVPPGTLMNPVGAYVLSFSDSERNGAMNGCVAWTTLFMFLSIPMLYRGIFRMQKDRRTKLILIAAVTAFFVVGTFCSGFIHVRYRIIYDLVYFALFFAFRAQWKYQKKISLQ